MADPKEKPGDEKLSPWKQFLEDLSWDIPFFRAIGNLLLGLFIEEGKAVRSGWFAFLIFTAISFWAGCHYSEQKIDSKFENITNYFSGELTKKDSQISELTQNIVELRGELNDAKHDRDHYQEMLAPFEAMAIAKYTNAPMDQRLDLLASGMAAITNALKNMNAEKAILGLKVNQTYLTNVDISLGAIVPETAIPVEISNEIVINIPVLSKTTPAIDPNIDIMGYIDQTNISADGWTLEPKNDDGRNHWHIDYKGSISYSIAYQSNPIRILPSFKENTLHMTFLVHADNSISYEYAVKFEILDRP